MENIRCPATSCQQTDSMSQALSWRGRAWVVQKMGEEWLERDIRGNWENKQSLGEMGIREPAPIVKEWATLNLLCIVTENHRLVKDVVGKIKLCLCEADWIQGRLWVPYEWQDGAGRKGLQGRGSWDNLNKGWMFKICTTVVVVNRRDERSSSGQRTHDKKLSIY